MNTPALLKPKCPACGSERAVLGKMAGESFFFEMTETRTKWYQFVLNGAILHIVEDSFVSCLNCGLVWGMLQDKDKSLQKALKIGTPEVLERIGQ